MKDFEAKEYEEKTEQEEAGESPAAPPHDLKRARGVFAAAWANMTQNMARNNVKARVAVLLGLIVCFLGCAIVFTTSAYTDKDAPHRLVTGMYNEGVTDGKIELKKIRSTGRFRLTMQEADAICAAHPSLRFYKIGTLAEGFAGFEHEGVAEISAQNMQARAVRFGKLPTEMHECFVTERLAAKILAQAHPSLPFDDMEGMIGYKFGGEYRPFVLSGIVEDFEPTKDFLYVREGFMAAYGEYFPRQDWDSEGDFYHLYFTLSGDFDADYAFFKAYHGDTLYHGTRSPYYITTDISGYFYEKTAADLAMAPWLYGIGFLLVAFGILASELGLYTVIRNDRDDGFARYAPGYRKRDLLAVYFLQVLLPFVVLLPLTLAAGSTVLLAVNRLVLKKRAVDFGLYVVSGASVGWLLLLCAGIVLIECIPAFAALARRTE